jgi:asparagine synthase (glutamine-hydrolysing)
MQFWNYPVQPNSIRSEDAVAAVRQTLDDSVKEHLVADVPVGVFLSSGLDSTIVAALAAKHSPHIRSFTVGFADQPDMSEAALATETAQLFGLEHTNVTINGADAAAQAIEWLSSLDQPSMDGLNVYVISKAIRAQGITVALSGQGGDELFGGYPSFTDVPRLMRLMRHIRPLPIVARSLAGAVATVGKPRAVRLKFQDMLRTDASVLELYLQRRRAMSNGQLRELGIEPSELGLDATLLLPETRAATHSDGEDPVFTISQLESRFYQGNMLLRDGDTNGMAHSLEIRVPILDQRMLNLAYCIPGAIKLPPGQPGKYLLRQAFAPELRPALLEQKKRGFTLPIRRWMLGPLREMCEQANATLKERGLFRPEGIDQIWQTFLREPESPAWSRAFTLLVLGHYVARHT